MTQLERLKLLTEERDGPEGCTIPRMFTDEELAQLLELHGNDLHYTAYDVLLRAEGIERNEVDIFSWVHQGDSIAEIIEKGGYF